MLFKEFSHFRQKNCATKCPVSRSRWGQIAIWAMPKYTWFFLAGASLRGGTEVELTVSWWCGHQLHEFYAIKLLWLDQSPIFWSQSCSSTFPPDIPNPQNLLHHIRSRFPSWLCAILSGSFFFILEKRENKLLFLITRGGWSKNINVFGQILIKHVTDWSSQRLEQNEEYFSLNFCYENTK